ncbi:polysaccharide biosynthesis tyrosine autokinase [Marinihelvus fidelis]|uniref:non-specific protein-tyrosine kinase n=1 Tax=Marinihelvus fidelis TaxID=2613842 RepID=A0A5N0TEN1_9GAMM|nr:polysaccharide biosynthesis tyrosine autokinase [Marinihelvus fidelis]KAA9133078.1 polysaccharide biosynthesis tyrosine autokinase [Marinihelvus fidelis]
MTSASPEGASLPESSASEPFPLLDYLQLLWFRRRLIVLVTLLVAVVGYLHVNQLTSVYTARSSLMIGVHDSRPVDLDSMLYQRYFGPEALEEVEVLKSRGLSEKVIERLDLLSHPEFNPSLRGADSGFSLAYWIDPRHWIPQSWKDGWRGARDGELIQVPPGEEELERRRMVRAVDIYLSRLSVTPVEFTDIIQIGFRSADPRVAAQVANELPEAFITDKLEAKLEASERMSGWLADQLAELERKVRDSEQAVEMYRAEHGLTQGARGDILSEQLSSINSQLIIARAERAEAEARLAQVNRLVAADGGGVETAGEVLSSPLIQEMRSQEAAVMRRQSELAVEYGPKHPRMLQVDAELGDIRNRIGEEIQKIITGLENEVEVARTREASLGSSLREAESRSGAQNREAVQLRALEREAAANRALFETFLGRFKESSSTEGTETPDARILSRAEIPGSPSWPNRGRMLATIILLGFVGACALVFALHLLSPGMFSPEQVEQELGMHAIGVLPRVEGKIPPHQHVIEKDNSGYVEAVNSLKIALQLSDPDARIKAIQVTSSVPEEGKTSLVLTLGTVLAKTGSRVIIVDGDLRRSSIEKKLELPADAAGLTDYMIAREDAVEPFLLHHEGSGLDILLSGDARYVSASDLFASKRMRQLIERLKQDYDYVLVDAPPVMAVADARVIGTIVDKTLFVVRWDKTPRKVARAALDQLRKSGTDIAGIVLQQVDLKRYGRLGYGDSGYYYHYGRYGQYYNS